MHDNVDVRKYCLKADNSRNGQADHLQRNMAGAGGGNDIQWCFSQVKGAVDDDVAEGMRAFNNAEFGYRIFSKSRLLKDFLAAESVLV